MNRRTRFLLVLSLTISAIPMLAQQPAQTKAWDVLNAGLTDKDAGERAVAVRVLGLLPGDAQAQKLALTALKDEKPEVRAAAADTLGQLKAKSAATPLADTILGGEQDVSVILACARSLILLGDARGYNVYYAVLTGERKTGASLLDQQKKMLKDPKALAQFGFEQGIGFIPFAGLGYGAFKMMNKDDVSPVRAAATKMLINDPDPKTTAALVAAAGDKSWIVRMAALEALGRRGNRTVVPQIETHLDDEKDVVRYTAAGAIIRLSNPTK
jgi:HEAT repeat protein